jgi:hypothetical protein
MRLRKARDQSREYLRYQRGGESDPLSFRIGGTRSAAGEAYKFILSCAEDEEDYERPGGDTADPDRQERIFAAADRMIEAEVAAVAHKPDRIFALFAQQLQVVFEAKTGQPASARQDAAALGKHSPFTHFALAIWRVLPAYNKKTRSLSQMASRLKGNLLPVE